MNEFCSYSALTLGEKISSGALGVAEVCKAYLAVEDKLNAFVFRDEATVLKEAARVQQGIKNGLYTSPLAGVPIAVKDNICTRNIPTTCASKMLRGFVPPYDAAAVRKLKAAGMIIIGKTNMDEFAMGSTNETSAFGAVLNPFDTARVAGGSSGGSAAAVAGGLAPLALGSDTGGSVRLPAAYCGLVGLKPTYGAVSRYGLIAYASSLDTVGTLCRDASDTAALLNVISGQDERDSTSRKTARVRFAPEGRLKGLKIGVLEGTPQSAVSRFERLGAAVEAVSPKLLSYAVPVYYIIACAEASSNLARYDGIRFGHRSEKGTTLEALYRYSRTEAFGAEVKKRIMLGNFVLSAGYYDAYYLKALKVKRLIYNELTSLLESFDFLLAPVTHSAAPQLGKSLETPIDMYKSDVYNVLANLTGLPAVAFPSGEYSEGKSCSAQLIGHACGEEALLNAVAAFEKE